MESTAVQKIARVLNVLVLIALICNLIILFLVPTAVFVSGGEGLLEGVHTAVILWQARRVLRTILGGAPFSMENAVSLKRAAVSAFLIAAAALARVVWSVWYYRSALPLASYNALFVPLFAMAGLLCLVMSALFRQAAELKAENDLTI